MAMTGQHGRRGFVPRCPRQLGAWATVAPEPLGEQLGEIKAGGGG